MIVLHLSYLSIHRLKPFTRALRDHLGASSPSKISHTVLFISQMALPFSLHKPLAKLSLCCLLLMATKIVHIHMLLWGMIYQLIMTVIFLSIHLRTDFMYFPDQQ